MNWTESRLHSWKPRRPSASLKRRIFSQAPARKIMWALGWLAPATACVLLTLTVINRGSVSGGSASPEPMVAMALSNQSYAPYLAASFRPVQNRLSSVTFDWTNCGASTSTTGFFSPGRVN